MKNRQNNSRRAALGDSGGFWHRVRDRWLGGLNLPGLGLGQDEGDSEQRIKVWDRQRGCYRYVDLSDRTDPLWSSASAVATLQRENDSRRTAA
jgi:hypothetical protein